MTCNQSNTFEGLILRLSYIYLQDGATTITGLQYCSSSQFYYPLVNWGRVGGPLAVSEQDKNRFSRHMVLTTSLVADLYTHHFIHSAKGKQPAKKLLRFHCGCHGN